MNLYAEMDDREPIDDGSITCTWSLDLRFAP